MVVAGFALRTWTGLALGPIVPLLTAHFEILHADVLLEGQILGHPAARMPSKISRESRRGRW